MVSWPSGRIKRRTVSGKSVEQGTVRGSIWRGRNPPQQQPVRASCSCACNVRLTLAIRGSLDHIDASAVDCCRQGQGLELHRPVTPFTVFSHSRFRAESRCQDRRRKWAKLGVIFFPPLSPPLPSREGKAPPLPFSLAQGAITQGRRPSSAAHHCHALGSPPGSPPAAAMAVPVFPPSP